MTNMELYERFRPVPDSAKKQIGAGRLKGMTDINPMWRIKALTEAFGPCGIGWKYEIVRREMAPGAKDEVAAFVDINLYYKADDKWSDPIPGTGGSMFVTAERSGLHTSDECYKMALTDAISVAAKALGIGADVYWDRDRTKYSDPQQDIVCERCGEPLKPTKLKNGRTMQPQDLLAYAKKRYNGCYCSDCMRALDENAG